MTERSWGGPIKLLSDFKKEPQVILRLGNLKPHGISYEYSIEISSFHFLWSSGCFWTDELSDEFNAINSSMKEDRSYGSWLEKKNLKMIAIDRSDMYHLSENVEVEVYEHVDGSYYYLIWLWGRNLEWPWWWQQNGWTGIVLFEGDGSVPGMIFWTVDGHEVYTEESNGPLLYYEDNVPFKDQYGNIVAYLRQGDEVEINASSTYELRLTAR